MLAVVETIFVVTELSQVVMFTPIELFCIIHDNTTMRDHTINTYEYCHNYLVCWCISD